MTAPGTPTSLSTPQHALQIVLGTTIVWALLASLGDANPVWAMISVAIVCEPEVQSAKAATLSRVLHTLLGCVIGLLMVALPGSGFWQIPLGMGMAVLVGTHLVKLPGNWRIAPVTVALVMSAGVLQHSGQVALYTALKRAGEVLAGGGVAVLVSWGMSRFMTVENDTP